MAILYRDTAEPPVPTPPLDGDTRADVVVVGGGLTGLSTALHLAEGGAKVVLLEAEEPGWGASGRNGGQVNPGLKVDPDGIERDFGADLGRRMNAFAGGAPGLVFDLIARHGIRCDARRNGTLRAAVRAGHAAGVRTTAEQWARRGAPAEILEGAPLETMTGTGRYALAMLDRRGGDVNPLSFARGLAGVAVQAGARVHGGTRALGLARVGADWRARTARGTVSAAHVVLAGNGYTDGLWPGLARTVVPVFGAIAATAPLGERALREVMPSRAVLFESGAVTVYYRVDAGGRLLIGGRGPQREISDIGAIRHLVGHAEALWPAVRGAAWTHAWGGRLAMTRDHYPHIHEPAPGVSICLGYNGRGVAMGTAMGTQLARRILNPSAPFDMPVTAMKGIALHAMWPLGVRAAIAYGRMKDALGF
ncbi:MAG TPA: FAD-binding oxidoreductase [Steroidobacteraceae bacterium]|jgi:glycine/D-amino acid oxidase-like deaminating enzyme|nr:FAD-binding oxidoreductase [Steroidobacteraceae bacterium]